MPQCNENSRIKLLAERMAILMVVCRLKYGIGWDVWMREGLYTGETGDEFRAMPEFKVALDLIRNMIRRQDNEMALADKKSKTGPEQGLEPALQGGTEAAVSAGGSG